MKKYKGKVLLLLLIILAFSLRVYNIYWDQGYNFHPDERAIIMFTLPLTWPSSIAQFLSPQSPLNPHFFAYGSLPLYLLKIIASLASVFDPRLIQYEKIAIVGRSISALADIGTLILIYSLIKKYLKTKTALFAALSYALAVLPIQQSHFYTVDLLLTFFCWLTIWFCLRYYTKPTLLNVLLLGASFAVAMTTKFSALPLVVPLGVTFLTTHYTELKKVQLQRILGHILLSGVTFLIIFILLQPYALLDFSEFSKQLHEQSAMTKSAFTFPYTLQYVGKVPYIYELKNIFLWGYGPILSIFAIGGLIVLVKKLRTKKLATPIGILLSFPVVYFLIVGNFAVGWMRYMLPIYPLLAIFSGIMLDKFSRLTTKTTSTIVLSFFIAILLLIWPLSFLQIYTHENPRVQASEWIISTIPNPATIATEHWDDRLPLFGQDNYNFQELTLYDPDSVEKWEKINTQLSQTDYIIIASNRLYVPLQKLTDCTKLPADRCYPLTAQYYRKLFNNQYGFQKVAEFSNPPRIPLFNILINDQSADESFTVYDHPKVMIFKKNTKNKYAWPN